MLKIGQTNRCCICIWGVNNHPAKTQLLSSELLESLHPLGRRSIVWKGVGSRPRIPHPIDLVKMEKTRFPPNFGISKIQ